MSTSSIDKDDQFILNGQELGVRFCPEYQKVNTIWIKNNAPYSCLLLTYLSNPYLAIMDQFVCVTGIQQQKIHQSLLFAEFLIYRVFSALDSLSYDSKLSEVFPKPTKQQIQMFNKAYCLYEKMKKKMCTRQEIQRNLKGKYEVIPFPQAFNESKEFVQWFVKHNLFALEILPKNKKLERLHKLEEKFAQQIMFTHTKTGLPLIMLKRNEQRIYSLDDLIICRRNTPRCFPSVKQFAMKLFYELLNFQQTYGECYPCLSTESIEYEMETKNINIGKIALIFQQIGLGNKPSSLENFIARDFRRREFWVAPEQLQKLRTFTTERTLMWNYLMIVDKYERGRTFVEQSENKMSTSQRIITLCEAFQLHQQQKYLGEVACEIIDFCRSNNYEHWYEEKERPPYRILDSYFKQKKFYGLIMWKCKWLISECVRSYQERQENNLLIVIHLLLAFFTECKALYSNQWYESKKQRLFFEKMIQEIPDYQELYDKRKVKRTKWFQILRNKEYLLKDKSLIEELKVQVLESGSQVTNINNEVFKNNVSQIFDFSEKEQYFRSFSRYRNLTLNLQDFLR